MSAFSKLLGSSKIRVARTIVPLPPSAFADTWMRKPHGPVKMGMRLVSEAELTTAQRNAAATAWFDVPETTDVDLRIDMFNDNVITNVLAQVCAQADDISKPYFAPAPEALIREALTAGGIRHLWNAYSMMAIADGELAPEATAEQMAALGATLATEMPTLASDSQVRLRRLARAMLDEIALAHATTAPPLAKAG